MPTDNLLSFFSAKTMLCQIGKLLELKEYYQALRYVNDVGDHIISAVQRVSYEEHLEQASDNYNAGILLFAVGLTFVEDHIDAINESKPISLIYWEAISKSKRFPTLKMAFEKIISFSASCPDYIDECLEIERRNNIRNKNDEIIKKYRNNDYRNDYSFEIKLKEFLVGIEENLAFHDELHNKLRNIAQETDHLKIFSENISFKLVIAERKIRNIERLQYWKKLSRETKDLKPHERLVFIADQDVISPASLPQEWAEVSDAELSLVSRDDLAKLYDRLKRVCSGKWKELGKRISYKLQTS